MAAMTLSEFVATRVQTDNLELTLGGPSFDVVTKGYVYLGTFYIEQHADGKYYLPIERDEFESDNLEELEAILFKRHSSL
jgi:hypothetical protein